MSAPRRRRWPWLLLLFVVASVVAAGVVYVRWESFSDRAKEAHQQAEANVDALVDRLDLEESARTSGRAVDRIRGFDEDAPSPGDGRVKVKLVGPAPGDDLANRLLLAAAIGDAGYWFVAEYCVDGWAQALIANSAGEANSVSLSGSSATIYVILETGTNFDHEQYSVDDFKFRPDGVVVSRNDRTFDLEGSVGGFDFSQSERGCWASGR